MPFSDHEDEGQRQIRNNSVAIAEIGGCAIL
jgi:hypothetical protein